LSDPLTIWNSCVSVTSACAGRQVPAAFAGTIHRYAVHYVVQSSLTVTVSSAARSPIVTEFDTMRVPGFMSRIFGRSLRLMFGSRNIVMTVAFEKSLSNRSAFSKVAFPLTPAAAARAQEDASPRERSN